MEKQNSSASEVNSNKGEEVTEEAATGAIVEDKLFVAVDKEVKASKSTLLWALHNSGGKKICILYVHQPAQTISLMGGKFPISTVSEVEVRAHREKERREMNKFLEEYLQICAQTGVQAETVFTDNLHIETGIIELITQLRIAKLVMGAAADHKYSRKMVEPKSKKAIYVQKKAPAYCNVWFICNGRLIHTREGVKASNYDDGGKSSEIMNSLEYPSGGHSTQNTWVDSESSFAGFDRSLTSERINVSPSSSNRMGDEGNGILLLALAQPDYVSCGSSDSKASESNMNHMLYEELQKAKAEAENSKQRASEESIKREKAERDSLHAIQKAKSIETLYMEELNRLREVEKELEDTKEQWDYVLEELAKTNQELEDTKTQKDLILGKLAMAKEELEGTKNNRHLVLEQLAKAKEELKYIKSRQNWVLEEISKAEEELEDTKKLRDLVLEELRVALDQKSSLEIRAEKMLLLQHNGRSQELDQIRGRAVKCRLNKIGAQQSIKEIQEKEKSIAPGLAGILSLMDEERLSSDTTRKKELQRSGYKI